MTYLLLTTLALCIPVLLLAGVYLALVVREKVIDYRWRDEEYDGPPEYTGRP